jgi:hypothetical protein
MFTDPRCSILKVNSCDSMDCIQLVQDWEQVTVSCEDVNEHSDFAKRYKSKFLAATCYEGTEEESRYSSKLSR